MQTTTTQQAIERAAEALTDLFPKTDSEPTYSPGFQKWMKLSRAKKLEMMKANDWNQRRCIMKLSIVE